MFKDLEKKLKKAFEAHLEAEANLNSKDEDWVWVEGYKGTNGGMECRDYKYEFGKRFDMPDDVEIRECHTGFHLCLTLKDVFNYYGIGDGHRFFRVRALVRRDDLADYDKEVKNEGTYFVLTTRRDKLVAKSIEFLSELSIDEILADTEATNFPEKYKQIAIQADIKTAVRSFKNSGKIENLIELGYCEDFATYVVNNIKAYDVAYAVGKQQDLSMDMKVFAIIEKACDKRPIMRMDEWPINNPFLNKKT